MENPIIMHFVTLTIFSLMLAIGLSHSFKQLTSLWSQPALLVRSLLSVIVLVPILVGLLLWIFQLPPAVATGLAVLAAAPGAPLTTKRSQMAGGDPTYSASLQLTLALLAVAITPLILGFFYARFELLTERVTAIHVARQVAQVTFLPVIIGLLIQRFAPAVAKVLAKPVRIIANVLFLLLLAVILVLIIAVPELRNMLRLGWPPIVAIMIMVAVSLIIGHLLGGPQREQRSALAIASIARNVGLALFIANLSHYGQQFIPTVVTFMILGALLAIPYAAWSKRQLKKEA